MVKPQSQRKQATSPAGPLARMAPLLGSWISDPSDAPGAGGLKCHRVFRLSPRAALLIMTVRWSGGEFPLEEIGVFGVGGEGDLWFSSVQADGRHWRASLTPAEPRRDLVFASGAGTVANWLMFRVHGADLFEYVEGAEASGSGGPYRRRRMFRRRGSAAAAAGDLV